MFKGQTQEIPTVRRGCSRKLRESSRIASMPSCFKSLSSHPLRPLVTSSHCQAGTWYVFFNSSMSRGPIMLQSSRVRSLRGYSWIYSLGLVSATTGVFFWGEVPYHPLPINKPRARKHRLLRTSQVAMKGFAGAVVIASELAHYSLEKACMLDAVVLDFCGFFWMVSAPGKERSQDQMSLRNIKNCYHFCKPKASFEKMFRIV